MTTSINHNMSSLLDEAAARHPDRTALVFGHQRLSFSVLLHRVKQAADLLQQYGLKRGERVIIMIPMSPDLYTALLAVIRCGAVAVFVDPWISMGQIAAFSAFAEPSGFIGIPKSHLLRFWKPRLAHVKISVSTGKVMCGVPAKCSLMAMDQQAGRAEPVPVAPTDPALITFTSGSSGVPKGANRTHGFLKAQYEALCEELDYQDGDIDMPMFPVFALRNLAGGMTSVIPDMDFRKVADINPDVINRQIQQNGVTLVTASPPFIDQLAKVSNPPALRKIFTGGAVVTAKQLTKWHAVFPDTQIDIIYGSTEAEPVAHLSSHQRLAADDTKGFCCGKPTPLVKTRMIEIRKGPVAPEELDPFTLSRGEIGELIVAGRHIGRDYYNNPDAVRENKIMEPDGTCWHRTGDTGFMDASGQFFLTGRVHTTVMRKGKQLQAQLLEAEAEKLMPGAKRAAALELDGKLVMVIQGAPIPNPEQLMDADTFLFTRKPLPVDPRHHMKIDYAALRKSIKNGRLRMNTSSLTSDAPFLRRFRAYLAERFALPNHISMVIIYFLANQFLAQVLGNPGQPLQIGWFTLLGTVFLFCIFFHLRVFDEHKDYADDCRHYPDRLLSRGIITLKELKIVCGLALAIELLCAAASGRPAVVAVTMTIFFSWVMLHEFFVRTWLRAHFIVYAISHMLIMPLMTATIFSFTMKRPFWDAPWLFWAYAAADFFAFANWEISRKIRLPEDEIDGVSSYSKEFGMFTAGYVVLGLRVLNTVLAWIVGVYLNLGAFYYGGLIVLFLLTLVGLLRFRLQPSQKTAKNLEAYGGGYIILFYFVLAAELFRTHGVVFGGAL